MLNPEQSAPVMVFQSLSGNLRVPARQRGCQTSAKQNVSIPFREFEGSGKNYQSRVRWG